MNISDEGRLFFASRHPSLRLAGTIGVAFLVYWLLGGLGLSLGTYPGYVSPVFPAAGFAVALMLWSANKAWPGIWLGSLALNLGVAWWPGNLTLSAVITALGIASGATLQAFVASRLVQSRVKNAWSSLEQEKDILQTLFWAGPVACLISATLGVVVLYALQIIPASACLQSWWHWWTGDTLGVVVFMPLTLAAVYRKESPWRERRFTVVLPMLIALGIVAGGYISTDKWEKTQQELHLAEHGESVAQVLEQRIIAHQEALSSLRRFIELMPDMTYRQFEYFTAITLKDNPDVFALSFNSYVTDRQRESFEKEMAPRSGIPGFSIRERDSQRQLVKAGKRSDYVVVGYIAPLEGNRPALGFDIYSEPLRRDAIEQAKRWGSPAATAPIQLVQDNKPRVGVLVLHPAYRKQMVLGAAMSESNLLGFAVGVIKIDEMVEIAIRSVMVDGLGFQIEDALSKQIIYRSQNGVDQESSRYLWQKELVIGGRTWNLKAWSNHVFIEQHRTWPVWASGVIGLFFAALLQILILIITGRTTIFERKLREQTHELKLRNNTVQDRNAQLDALFSLSPDGFVAFAPDGCIKFANPAFQVMTGIEITEIIGWQSEAYLDVMFRQQMENPESFAGLASCFSVSDEMPKPLVVTLQQPRHTVLQLVGIRSEATSVSRILYLRDITSEAEVDHMKSEFLSHAAHELRTPMASIYGFAELLLEMEFDEATRRDLLETIHRQSRWLVDIINELLDLARIEARQGKDFVIKDVDLKGLVQDTVGDLSFDLERWPVVLDLTPAIGAVRADPTKFRQALINVLNNAQKYSPEGGTIKVDIVARAGQLGVAVSDQGIGMSGEQIKRIGERFWRADTSGKIPGTGLGMTIVKEILQFQGGQVEVSSKPNAGTTVTLWLPGVDAHETR